MGAASVAFWRLRVLSHSRNNQLRDDGMASIWREHSWYRSEAHGLTAETFRSDAGPAFLLEITFCLVPTNCRAHGTREKGLSKRRSTREITYCGRNLSVDAELLEVLTEDTASPSAGVARVPRSGRYLLIHTNEEGLAPGDLSEAELARQGPMALPSGGPAARRIDRCRLAQAASA